MTDNHDVFFRLKAANTVYLCQEVIDAIALCLFIHSESRKKERKILLHLMKSCIFLLSLFSFLSPICPPLHPNPLSSSICITAAQTQRRGGDSDFGWSQQSFSLWLTSPHIGKQPRIPHIQENHFEKLYMYVRVHIHIFVPI